jgi:hypothetical protein
MHVSFSSMFSGVGVFAGPPYWCAQSDVEVFTIFSLFHIADRAERVHEHTR